MGEPGKNPYKLEFSFVAGEHSRTPPYGRSANPSNTAGEPASLLAGMEPHMTSLDSFKCARTLKVGTKTYVYYSLPAAEKNGLKGISRLPFSLKVLLENLLRIEDGR